jgi:hypothetical protein
VTTYLDACGAASLVLFAFAIWPPLALGVFGGLCLWASWKASTS